MRTRLFIVTYHREDSPETLTKRMLAVNEADVVQKLGNDDSFDDCITISITKETGNGFHGTASHHSLGAVRVYIPTKEEASEAAGEAR